jgi:hypothetical protein
VSSSVTGGSTNGLSVVGACDARADDEARCARLRGLSTNCCLVRASPAQRERASEKVRPRTGTRHSDPSLHGAKKSEIERRWTNHASATISLYWLTRAR